MKPDDSVLRIAAPLMIVSTTLLVVAMPALVSTYLDMRELQLRGRNVVGVVTSSRCTEKGRINWEARTPEGTISGVSADCGVPCGGQTRGRPVTVWYLEARPGMRACGSVELKAQQSLLFTWLLPVAYVLIALGCVVTYKRALRSGDASRDSPGA